MAVHTCTNEVVVTGEGRVSSRSTRTKRITRADEVLIDRYPSSIVATHRRQRQIRLIGFVVGLSVVDVGHFSKTLIGPSVSLLRVAKCSYKASCRECSTLFYIQRHVSQLQTSDASESRTRFFFFLAGPDDLHYEAYPLYPPLCTRLNFGIYSNKSWGIRRSTSTIQVYKQVDGGGGDYKQIVQSLPPPCDNESACTYNRHPHLSRRQGKKKKNRREKKIVAIVNARQVGDGRPSPAR